MWARTFMRLLSLSFMSFFVIGLLWQEGRRRDATAARQPVAGARKDRPGAPPAADR